MKAYRRSLAGLSESLRNDILEIRYERLCESKEDVMNDVLLFSGLEPSSDYQRVVTSYTLESRDHKWKQYLTARQQRELNQALEELDWEKYVSRLENVRSSG